MHENVQLIPSCLPKINQFQVHLLWTITPSNAFPQRGWTFNKHIQGPMYCVGLLNIPRLTHAKLGLPLRVGGYYLKLTLPLNIEPQSLGVCAIKCHLWMQQKPNPPSPSHQKPSAQQTAKQRHLGTTQPRRMVCTSGYDTLYMPYRTYPRYHRNDSPTWRNSSQFRRNSQAFYQQMR